MRSATSTTPPTPRGWPDQAGPLDGGIDALAGHGTFIAGLVHQACPDADIVAWRIVGSEGPIVESDMVDALRGHRGAGPAASRRRAGRLPDRRAQPVDGLLPRDAARTSCSTRRCTTSSALLGECGDAVVCSAGNDATARPMFPAASCPWPDGHGPCAGDPARCRSSRVGALNPNGTDALFSNAGPWVRAYAPGASVMSTIPSFQGGLSRWPARAGRTTASASRSTPTTSRSGFALWSGTSFSAPLFAGRIAAALVGLTTRAGTTSRRPTRSPAGGRRWRR